MKKLFFPILALFIFSNCNKENDSLTSGDNTQKPSTTVMKARVAQDNTFAFDLLKNTIINSQEPNVVISPISVSIALGMTWNGADGDTKTEMETALKMSGLSDIQINEYYRYMQTTLPQIDPQTRLNIANSIWYRENLPIHSDFLNLNTNYFNAEVRGLDFSQANAVEIINNWCKEKTNSLIPKVLDHIPNDAVMYLINAIYFKGTWVTQFDANNTFTTNFNNETGQQTSVKMMNVSSDFNYMQDNYAQYLDMPYGNKSYSMTVILPNEGKTTNDVLDNLNSSILNQRLQQLTSQDVAVYMPRFKTKNQYLLNDILMNMGMKKAFIDRVADFSRISLESIFISRVLHDTYIEVTEEGTEAAAVTTVEGVNTSIEGNMPVFNVNKPFLFTIREKSTGIILFIGKMGEIDLF